MNLVVDATWRRFRRLAVFSAAAGLSLGLLGGKLTAGFAGTETPSAGRHDHGFSYLHDTVAEVPWSIHIFKLERANRDFDFCTTLGNGATQGLTTVSEQVKHLPPSLGEPVAAVNGDYYNKHEHYLGDPRDLQISQGEVVSAPAGHMCFWMDAAGNPHMTNVLSRFRVIWPDGAATPFGLNEERTSDQAVLYTPAVGDSTHTQGGTELVLAEATNQWWLPLRVGQVYQARVVEVRAGGDTALKPGTMVLSLGPELEGHVPKVQTGDTVRVITETVPNLAGVKTAVGGGPTLVRDGKAMEWGGIQMRHPRTAIGWNRDFIFLVEVDGRQSQLSMGMTFSELAGYMRKLGCEQAMNLDGGGSSTMWVLGNVMNSPSEGQERPGANALVVVDKRNSLRLPVQVRR